MKLSKLLLILASAIALNAVADESKAHYTDIPGVKANVLIKTTQSWNDGELLPYGNGQPEITIIRYQIDPGATLPMHMHPVINAGLLIKGQLTVIKKTGEALTVNAGQPIVELFKEWHYGTNPGKEPVDLVIVYAGTVGTPLVVRE